MVEGLPTLAADPIEDMDELILAAVAPELRATARALLAGGPPPILNAATLPILRDKSRAAIRPFEPEPPVRTLTVAPRGALGPITVYLINAGEGRLKPAILHLHGGGFVLNSARREVPRLQKIAAELDCVIATVEYALAPEAPWAISLEQNYACLRWLYEQAHSLGVDRARIVLMGESAGGGHAALLAIAARDRNAIPLAGQVLVYPMLDDRTVSNTGFPPAVGRLVWTAQANAFGWRSFLGSEGEPDGKAIHAVPARHGDLSRLPATFIGVGGIDLFVAEDIDYAARLIRCGVPTELLVVPGAFHGFDAHASSTSLASWFTGAKINAIRRMFEFPSLRDDWEV
ncbi:alpha/beta hydrolase [Tsuneonella dongtanensis]|uniref:alpha/beta hydrolase n=1 Tax=Tsuneonella dongtanensis TaxID=692370 RepID=UPI001E3EEC17|nr:alpha/beta hydrolase [Tsuneonella dongtanensis]